MSRISPIDLVGIKEMMNKLKTYDSYVRKANRYEFFKMRKKAIIIMKQVIQLPFSNVEKGSAAIYIGLLYKKLGDLTNATDYFDYALHLCENEQYPFSSNFKLIIDCFLENGDVEKASKWRTHLIERASYDQRFLKLKKK